MAILSVGKAYLSIVPDVSKLKSELTRQVDPAVKSSAKRLGRTMQGVGVGMTAGLTVPLIALGKSATTAFQESSKVAAQTDAVIKSTGASAGVTAGHVDKLSQSISAYSGIDDEAIASGQNMLLTFTNIRNEAGKGGAVFDRTTKILADMSTALGVDASTQAVQLGKALNDPIKGVSALSRVGVTFTDKQKRVIAGFVEGGEMAKAQGVILDELTKEFGGSAKAFGDSAAGSAAKSKVAWGNAMEDIGEALAPVVAAIGKMISTVARWFSGLPSGAKTAIIVFGALIAILGPVISMVGTLITIFPALGTAIAAAAGPIGIVIAAIAALIAIVVIVIKNWDTIKRVALRAWHAVTGAVRRAFGAIKRAALAVFDWFKRNWPTILAIITGPIGLAVLVVVRNWQKIKNAARAVFDWLKGAWRGVADVVRGVWTGIKSFISGIWEGIKSIVSSGVNFLIDGLNVIVRGTNTLIRGANLLNPFKDIPSIPEIPHLARGGLILESGIAVVHKGEQVVPPGGGPVEIVGRLSIDEDGFATIRAVVRDEQARGAAWARAMRARA